MQETSIVTKKHKSKINCIIYGNRAVERNSQYICLSDKNKVNVDAWISPVNEVQNIGDYLSLVIVEEMCKSRNVDFSKKTCSTKHLYAVGSILMGYQDATIWGSGFGYDFTEQWFFKLNSLTHKLRHNIDIRAVRGPETKRILKKMGYSCPDIFGDPAVLLPLFYNCELKHLKPYIVVPHYSKLEKYKNNSNILGTFRKKWNEFVELMCEADLVISSSLHGIILAEAYGIPAIMLNDTPSEDITKYKDWYYSTRRYEFPIASNIEEALTMTPSLPDREVIKKMQNDLIDSFPIDLWQ